VELGSGSGFGPTVGFDQVMTRLRVTILEGGGSQAATGPRGRSCRRFEYPWRRSRR
jgi:hypothetical protein